MLVTVGWGGGGKRWEVGVADMLCGCLSTKRGILVFSFAEPRNAARIFKKFTEPSEREEFPAIVRQVCVTDKNKTVV